MRGCGRPRRRRGRRRPPRPPARQLVEVEHDLHGVVGGLPAAAHLPPIDEEAHAVLGPAVGVVVPVRHPDRQRRLVELVAHRLDAAARPTWPATLSAPGSSRSRASTAEASSTTSLTRRARHRPPPVHRPPRRRRGCPRPCRPRGADRAGRLPCCGASLRPGRHSSWARRTRCPIGARRTTSPSMVSVTLASPDRPMASRAGRGRMSLSLAATFTSMAATSPATEADGMIESGHANQHRRVAWSARWPATHPRHGRVQCRSTRCPDDG